MGEDEIEANCQTSSSRICNIGEFKCSNNQCIPTAWVCDGALDCTNDEENCGKNVKQIFLESFFSFFSNTQHEK